MKDYFNPKYPDTASLRKMTRKRVPKFAYDYLIGGCGDEVALTENRNAIKEVRLFSEYLKPYLGSNIEVDLFGHTYSTPFGIAPIGLQGLVWPKAPEYLAKAAHELNIPYVLSTVSSTSLEKIADISEGHAWYQLYNPTDPDIRKDLINRVKQAGYKVMMVTVDVPTFGYRSRDIKNGLSMPPKMSASNILQMIGKPKWLVETTLAGKPELKTLKPYMTEKMELAPFMNKVAMGRVDHEALKVIRDAWPGKLIIKGIIHESDVKHAISIGADGVVLSNHGGRQLDAGLSPIHTMKEISEIHGDKIKIMMDSGLENGSDIACALASGAHMTFLGRTFTYGVAALGEKGAYHTINMLKTQITQVIEQLRCHKVSDLKNHLVK